MSEKLILVIDDEDIMHDSFREALEQEGHRIESAYNGKEGIEFIKRHNPDIIFLDLNMPACDGFYVLEKMNTLRHNTSKLCVMSGDDFQCARLQLTGLEVDVFLEKPFDVNQIRNLVYYYTNAD